MPDLPSEPSGLPPAGMPAPETHRATAAPGSTLRLPPGSLWRLTAGDVAVYVAGRPVEVWRAPRVLDLAGSLRGRRNAIFVACGNVEIHGVPLDAVPPAELADALAAENTGLWARIEADARRDDDTFLPLAAPVPGPWHFRRAEAIALVVQGEPDRLRAALPRGLRLLPGTRGRYLLVVTRFEGAGSLDPRDPSHFGYHEVTPFVPVWSRLRGPAAFVPELYPDAWMAVILGREIHGFPKRTARVGFHEEGAELIVERRVALRVRHGEMVEARPHHVQAELFRWLFGSRRLARLGRSVLERLDPGGLPLAVLVHKRIGAHQTAGRTLAIDELVRVPITVERVTRAHELRDLEVDIPGGPGVLHGEVLAGFRLHSGLRFGEGRLERRPGSRR